MFYNIFYPFTSQTTNKYKTQTKLFHYFRTFAKKADYELYNLSF